MKDRDAETHSETRRGAPQGLVDVVLRQSPKSCSGSSEEEGEANLKGYRGNRVGKEGTPASTEKKIVAVTHARKEGGPGPLG